MLPLVDTELRYLIMCTVGSICIIFEFMNKTFLYKKKLNLPIRILTTNLAAVVCVDVCQCAKFDQFLPALISNPNVPKILFA